MRKSVAAWGAGLGALSATVAVVALSMTNGDDGPVDSPLKVTQVEGLAEDFMLGADVSSVLSLEASGVVFKDAAGNPSDLFELLKEAGATTVRVRVWNDPFDAAGCGYGGGTVDAVRATEIAERATAAGLGVMVDFHYSDFWADPAKQMSPKAWVDLDASQKAEQAGAFTVETLELMKQAGVNVVMVQVGNETNNGVAGETSWPAMTGIFSAGSAAVRQVYPEALVAVHFANPEAEGEYARYASILDNYEVDYDVFASSYYPFWHGTLENLTALLSQISADYGKQVMVAETSWVTTLEDLDGSGNVISDPAIASAYPVSEQGQVMAFRDVVAAVAAVGEAGIGVMYWEPAWIAVGPPSETEANAQLWERDGSGWATSCAGEYDPEGAGVSYGGSGWENHAMFAPDGTALESLKVFSFVRTGTTAPLAAVQVESPALEVQLGNAVDLPETVDVLFNDGSRQEQSVTWDQPSGVDAVGTVRLEGTLADGTAVTGTLTVVPHNDLANPSFEDDDLSAWVFDSDAATFEVVSDNVPAARGLRVVNVWNDAAYNLSLSQQVSGLEPGVYTATVDVHGLASGGAGIALIARGSDGEWSAPLELAGWQAWQTARLEDVVVGADGTITIAVEGSLGAGDWAFIDAFTLAPAQP